MNLTALLVGLMVATVFADGQMMPSGQYPPGSMPPMQGPGGGGLSIPRPKKRGKEKAAEPDKPNFTVDGQVVSLDAKSLVVSTDDGRLLTLSVAPATIWQRDAKPIASSHIKPGMVVHLDAIEDGEAYLTAATVNVTADKQLVRRPLPTEAEASQPKPQPRPDVPETTTAPDPTGLGSAPDDPDRPVLRRGKPANTVARSMPSAPTGSTAANSAPVVARKSPAPASGELDFSIDAPTDTKKLSTGVPTLVSQTRDWVTTFTNGLPNYVAQQLTTRYSRESKSDDWHPLDVVGATVLYQDGNENYKDITVGGKRVNKSMMDIGGTTSTGEFAATMRDLFAPETDAHFNFAKNDSVGSTTVAVYHYTVDLDRSHWSIKVGGQLLRPAYSGEVWINKQTGEVRKIEMQADNIPANFPFRDIYSSVAYDPVRLGTSNFLLPVLAVLQSCERKSAMCTKNDVEWRNYHKYSGESTITYQ